MNQVLANILDCKYQDGRFCYLPGWKLDIVQGSNHKTFLTIPALLPVCIPAKVPQAINTAYSLKENTI